MRDADLQAGADRYVRESLRKTSGMDGTPWFLLRRMGWYFSRIWVEVTPESVLWWPGGDLSVEPRELARRPGRAGTAIRPCTGRTPRPVAPGGAG